MLTIPEFIIDKLVPIEWLGHICLFLLTKEVIVVKKVEVKEVKKVTEVKEIDSTDSKGENVISAPRHIKE